MFRLIFLTFHGQPRFDEHHVHVHESPKSILAPLVILAVLSIAGGWMAAPAFWGGPDHFTAFLAPVFGAGGAEAGAEAAGPAAEAAARSLELTMAGVAVLTALAGFLIAFWLYIRKPGTADRIANSVKGGYTTLLNKYYVDEIYAALIVAPLVWISDIVLWRSVDDAGIDGAVNGVAQGTTALGDRLRRVQSGNTRSYAVWVVIGAFVVILAIFWPLLKPAVGMVP
jgi:NADH-quinone oxidoreductase subunit L